MAIQNPQFNTGQMSSQADRVAELLRRAADQQTNTPQDNSTAMFSALSEAHRIGGDPMKSYQGLLDNTRKSRTEGLANQVQMESSIYDLMQKQIAAGNQQVKTISDFISERTNDPAEHESVWRALRDDPEEITPLNMYQKIPAAMAQAGIQPRRKKEDYLSLGDGTALDITSGETVGQRKAPAGYQYADDGSTLTPIPGGPNAGELNPGQSMAKGKAKFDQIIQEMSANYNDLETKGGVVSHENPWYENAPNYLARSAGGQMVAGMMGTEEQAIVEKIKSARPLLSQAIMQATGMSARQLDSNVELKLWLDSLTNPSADIEANRAILSRLQDMFGSGAQGGESGSGTGKIRVSNGTEIFEIDSKDLPDAEAEGFEAVQ